jgi:hypothetical protein
VASSVGRSRSGAGRRRSVWRLIGLVLGGVGLVLLVLLAGYERLTAPVSGRDASGRPVIDPELVGRLEQRAWAAYYLRRWPELFDLLLRLSRDQFGLSLPLALRASYVGTQAQVVFAQKGAADGEAERLMRQFYELIREPSGGRYDPTRAAELELRWWVVHRQRDQYPDHSALAAALADTYAEVYQRPASELLAAGEARAAAMDLSDRWVREGRVDNSPLLDQIADLLTTSYRALGDATTSP